MRARSLALALVIAPALSPQSVAQPRIPALSATTAPQATVQHMRMLGELGFRDGASLGGLGETQDFFFPLPGGIKLASATLHLAYDVSAVHAGRRTLEVWIGDRILLTRAITGSAEDQLAEIPIPAERLKEKYLKVTVRYAGAITENRCLDQRFGGDHLVIRPATGLRLSFAPSQVDSIAAAMELMPKNIVVTLPDRLLDEHEVAAAVAAVRLLHMRGHDITVRASASAAVQPGSGWSQGEISIGASSASTVAQTRADGSAHIRMHVGASGPVIVIAGRIPERALTYLGSRWEPSALAPALGVGAVRQTNSPNNFLSFRALGHTSRSVRLVDEASFDLPFTAMQMPFKTRPTAVALDLLTAPADGTSPTVASLFINGELLGSRAISSAEPEHVEFPLPDGITGLSNSLRLVLQRQPEEGGCQRARQGRPVELLGSSGLVLGEAEAPHSFSGLVPFLKEGVAIRIDAQEPARQRSAIALLGKLLANLAAPETPIMADDGRAPLISFGENAPQDAQVPLLFDHGRVVLRGPDGESLLDMTGLSDLLSIQVMRLPQDRPGLWVRLGGTGDIALPENLTLDRGDFALIDHNGNVVQASSRTEGLEIAYPARASWAGFVERYRMLLLGGLWLGLSIGFFVMLRRLLAKRGKGQAVS